MKYTVVIRQPVPETILPQLTQDLSQQFELSMEQAAKLASRRNGRLMKPTSRRRAELLFQVFQAVGAQVTLEEVRDDTTLLSDPFAHERPGLVGPSSLPMPGADAFAAPMSAVVAPALGAADSPSSYSSPYGSGPLMASEHAQPDAFGSISLGSTPATAVSDWDSPIWTPLSSASGSPASELTSAAGIATLPPLPGLQEDASGPHGSPVFASTFDAGVMLPHDPLESESIFVQHDGPMIQPEHVVSGVPEMNLGGLLSARTAPAGQVQPATEAAPFVSQISSEPISDDAWADFTGSLNSTPTLGAVPKDGPSAIMTVDTSLDPVRGPRRSSLLRRVLLSTLLPLGLFTLLTLGFLVYALPRAQRQLITENAQAVAVAVGSSLDVTDQNTVYAQLDALIKRSSVGFVQVNLPDGTTFFRSKNAYTDGPLSEQIAAWVQKNPNTSTFVQSGSAADSYRYQLSLLEQVGAGDSDQAKSLRLSVADPANQKSSTNTYLLSSINVTQDAQGERQVTQGVKPGAGTPLYSIVVGVPGDAAFAQLRNLLLLVLGVALLAFLIASALAARTARLVVQPIERLVRAADAISMGDLDRPVTAERNDEIGDLAQALERMRLSLEAAMGRLRRRRKGA
jgi:HAMP domain-containing protein